MIESNDDKIKQTAYRAGAGLKLFGAGPKLFRQKSIDPFKLLRSRSVAGLATCMRFHSSTSSSHSTCRQAKGERVNIEQLLRRNVKRFRGGLVFKAHRLLYHSSLGLRVIKKKTRFWH